MMNRIPRAALLALGALLVAGCTDIFPYKKNDLPENVTFTPQLSEGSVRMDVYDIDQGCNEQYQGSLQPGSHPVKVGMPVDQQRYLVVVFQGGTPFGASHATSTGMYFKPEPGVMYNIKANYADSMYDVQVLEHSHGAWRKVPEITPRVCKRGK